MRVTVLHNGTTSVAPVSTNRCKAARERVAEVEVVVEVGRTTAGHRGYQAASRSAIRPLPSKVHLFLVVSPLIQTSWTSTQGWRNGSGCIQLWRMETLRTRDDSHEQHKTQGAYGFIASKGAGPYYSPRMPTARRQPSGHGRN